MQILARLCEHLNISKESLLILSEQAPQSYKVYTIPKRNSGKRTIAHPSKKIKTVQRALVEILSKDLPVSKSATAYMKGSSIKKNAEIHRNSKYLLKMDFKNFFNSITPQMLWIQLHTIGIEIDNSDKKFLEQILFWSPSRKRGSRLVLSVGAPSSPFISNFVLMSFDSIITNYCDKRNIKYSRYADDMTFSTSQKNILFEIPSQVKYSAEGAIPQIKINDQKTVFSSKAHNMHVTGVTISSENKLSIGRKRKRLISGMINRFKYGMLDSELCSHLKGLIAFANDIEPDFIKRLQKKYSAEVLTRILKGEF